VGKDGHTKPDQSDDESGTVVDLGDDLLEEKTVILHREEEPAPRKPQTPVEELLANAKIQIAEGFIEDAKKALRRVLVLDRKNAFAQEMLRKILDDESKRLLSFEAEPRKRRPRAEVEAQENALSDLEMQLMEETGEPEATLNVVSFIDPAPEDRIDLGIGLLEMGFIDEAASQFRQASQAFAMNGAIASEQSAHALFAQAQLEAGRPLEAVMALQPVIKNPEIAPGDKIEFLYLMGRANAALGKHELALQWFEHVRELEPTYRDVHDRLETARRAIKAGSGPPKIPKR
jgi:tetratricopeptide (TPR) repeat protein